MPIKNFNKRFLLLSVICCSVFGSALAQANSPAPLLLAVTDPNTLNTAGTTPPPPVKPEPGIIETTDGTHWTKLATTGLTGTVNTIVYDQMITANNTSWLAGSTDGLFESHDNGKTWRDLKILSGGSPVNVTALVWVPNLNEWVMDGFINGHYSVFLTSPDEVNWTSQTNNMSLAGLSFNNVSSQLLVANITDNGSGFNSSSDGGKTWQTIGTTTGEINATATGPQGESMAVGLTTTGNAIIVKHLPNNTTWSTYVTSATVSSLSAIAYKTMGLSQWVAVGNGVIAQNGVDSVATTHDAYTNPLTGLNAVIWGGNQWTTFGNNGVIYTSITGFNWTPALSPTKDNIVAVASNGVLFTGPPAFNQQLLQVGQQGQLNKSRDGGLNWRPVSIPGSMAWANLQSVFHTPGTDTWLVGSDNGIFTSIDDGQNWTAYTPTDPTDLQNTTITQIAYIHNPAIQPTDTWLALAVPSDNSKNSILLMSNDGLNWTPPPTLPAQAHIRYIAVDNQYSQWLAVSDATAKGIKIWLTPRLTASFPWKAFGNVGVTQNALNDVTITGIDSTPTGWAAVGTKNNEPAIVTYIPATNIAQAFWQVETLTVPAQYQNAKLSKIVVVANQWAVATDMGMLIGTFDPKTNTYNNDVSFVPSTGKITDVVWNGQEWTGTETMPDGSGATIIYQLDKKVWTSTVTESTPTGLNAIAGALP